MKQVKFRAWDGSGKYVAGDDGLIYSTDYNHTGQTKALKICLDKDGYPTVLLNINKQRLYRTSHKLVALAFFGVKPTSKHQVNHKNGKRDDNRPENLEYVTPKENALHGWRVNGRKPSIKQIENGKRLAKETNKKRWSYE